MQTGVTCSMVSLAVIVPFYNELPAALRCLNTLQGTATAPLPYYVQDDCSPALSIDSRVLFHPFQASVERNPQNLGFAGNSNAGAARADADVLFFVNQDVFAGMPMSARWNESILAPFSDPQVGIVGARLLFGDGSGIQSVGGEFDAKCQPHHRCLGYTNLDYYEVNTYQEVPWVTGAALAIRRDVFLQVGGFDTGYIGGYFEDVSLCLTVREAGYKVMIEPACTLFHDVGSTGGSIHFAQNAQRFKRLWVDTGKVKPGKNAIMVNYW